MISAGATSIRALAIAALLTIAGTLPLTGQAVAPLYTTRAPRFLVTPSDSLRPPIAIDPRRVPALQRRISVHLEGLTLRQALKEVSRLSGLDFVYEVELVSADTVHLNATAITVAAVLTDLLSSTDVDVLLKPEGNAVLVKRSASVQIAAQPPAPPIDVIVRGHVIGPDSLPLVGAAVTVQAVAERVSKPTRTDINGAYQVVMPSSAGAYRIVVTLIGYAPQRRTLSRQAGDTATIVADFLMARSVTTLNRVQTTAQRPKPVRDNGDNEVGPGAQATTVDLGSGLNGDLTGDLTMALTMIPGLTVIPDPNGGLPTISAFGLGTDQNSVTLNGMDFGGTLPRDGVKVQVYTATYDPGRGSFSGVQTRTAIVSGTTRPDRTLHATLDDPFLQWTTPVSNQLGSRYTFPIVSGTLSGPIDNQQMFYNTLFQLQRRSNNLTTLTSANAASLEALGISPDSVARLLSALGPLGIPAQSSAAPSERITTMGKLFTRFDFTPNATRPTTRSDGGSEDVFYLLAGGTWTDNGGAGERPTALPSYGSESRAWAGTLQAVSSRYFGSVLNEATSAFNTGANHSQPYLTLPSASILLNSNLPYGNAAFSILQAAGNGTAESNARTWSWETRNETSWKTWDDLHTFKVTIDGTVDHYALSQGASFGAFTYNTLGDFASGTPTSFSRTLTGLMNDGGGVRGVVGLGDDFRVARMLFLQYGVRFEGNQLGVRPAYNPLVDSLFGLRTNHVPNTFTAMPMVGFTWYDGSRTDAGESLSGGIREYRGVFSTQSIFPYTRETGLPTAVQQIQCVGGAAPAPDWQSYAQSSENIPTQCADGSSGSPLAETSPPVLLYAPGYTLPESWRATLTWNKIITQSLRPYLIGTYALNLHQPGMVDANFNPQTRFTLADEGNRPVFVDPSSIVPATGAVSNTGSRFFPQLAQVAESETDFRSTTRQLTAGFNYLALDALRAGDISTPISASYTYVNTRAQTNGFGSTAAGDPREVDWGSTNAPHHRVQIGGSLRVPDWITVSANVQVRSGFSYTPRVNSDIMGDGYANDRAFVFNPATTSDAALATGMTNLLNTAPQAARECLLSQLGTIARQYSCKGPWTETLNLNAILDAYRLGFKNRGTVRLMVNNALGGADLLLHGPNHLQGWGQPAFPDQTLLNVRGFDPVANRFLYTVNPLFGSTTVAHNLLRVPFGITLDVRLDVGPDRETERIETAFLPRAADGVSVLNEGQIKIALTRPNVGSRIDRGLIQRRDSLKLTQAQVDTLTAINERYMAFRDSTYGVLAKYLASRHGDYDGEEVRTHWHDAIAAVVRRFVSLRPRLRELLTSELQRQALSTDGVLNFSDAQLKRYFEGPLTPF